MPNPFGDAPSALNFVYYLPALGGHRGRYRPYAGSSLEWRIEESEKAYPIWLKWLSHDKADWHDFQSWVGLQRHWPGYLAERGLKLVDTYQEKLHTHHSHISEIPEGVLILRTRKHVPTYRDEKWMWVDLGELEYDSNVKWDVEMHQLKVWLRDGWMSHRTAKGR